MNICECKSKCECSYFAIITSLVIGIAAVFLNLSATITVPPVFLQAVFGISIIFLLVGLLFASVVKLTENNGCVCSSVSQFLGGILSAVLFSAILLLIDLSATGIISSILIGLTAGSFALVLTSAVCIIKSVLKCTA